jgi:hypothetical protein
MPGLYGLLDQVHFSRRGSAVAEACGHRTIRTAGTPPSTVLVPSVENPCLR